MDVYMVILRLIHIFSGIIWVGSGLFMILFFVPSVRQLGPDAGKVMRTFFQFSRFNTVIPIVAGLTVLSGILLYARTSGNFNAQWLSSLPGVVLSIGAIAGILAAGHGGAVIRRTSEQMLALLNQLAEQQGPPSAEQQAQLQALQEKSARHGNISVLLMAIAVIGMTTFRYL